MNNANEFTVRTHETSIISHVNDTDNHTMVEEAVLFMCIWSPKPHYVTLCIWLIELQHVIPNTPFLSPSLMHLNTKYNKPMNQFKCSTEILFQEKIHYIIRKTWLAEENEMAQSVKCLLYKREDLSLDRQHVCNDCEQGHISILPALGREEGATRDH